MAVLVCGIKKKFGRTEKRRSAITPDYMKVILSKSIEPDLEQLNTTQLRLATLIFTMYFSAMRAEEAAILLMENISISQNGNLKITLIKGKTNQFKKRQDVYLVLAGEAQALCPVKIILK